MSRRLCRFLIVVMPLCSFVFAQAQEKPAVTLTPIEQYADIPTRLDSLPDLMQQEAVQPDSAGQEQEGSTNVQGRSSDDAPVLGMSMVPGIGGGFNDEYDLPRKTTLRDYLPTPGHQGRRNSCVAWAIAYAAYTCQISQQRHQKNPDEPSECFSATYLYDKLKTDDGGLDPARVIRDVIANGCASEANATRTDKRPGTSAATEAKYYRAISMERPTNLSDIKTFIYEGYPVILIVFQDNELRSPAKLDAPYRWSKKKEAGLHAITAVGYDDDQDAILIMNSRGPEWKDGGFCWVAASELEFISENGWCPRAYVAKVKKAAPFNIRTDDQRYQLKKDRRVYEYRGDAVTLSKWKIDDAVCTDRSLFVLSRNQQLFRYNDDESPTNWTVMNDGVLENRTIAMMAADDEHPLHILTSDGELFAYNRRNGGWQQVVWPDESAKVIDVRIDRHEPELCATTSSGRVYIRDTFGDWSLAP